MNKTITWLGSGENIEVDEYNTKLVNILVKEEAVNLFPLIN